MAQNYFLVKKKKTKTKKKKKLLHIHTENKFELKMLKLLGKHLKTKVREEYSHLFLNKALFLKCLTKKCQKSDFFFFFFFAKFTFWYFFVKIFKNKG